MKVSFTVLAVGALLGTAAAAEEGRSSDRRPSERHVERQNDRHHDRYRNPRYETAPAPRTGEANPYAPKVGAPNPYATQGGAPNPYATRGGDAPKPLYEEKPRRR
jgi:hypothetical protein